GGAQRPPELVRGDEDRGGAQLRRSTQRYRRGRRVFGTGGQLLELGDVVQLGTHRDVGHPFQDHLDDHRYPVFVHQFARLLERVGQLGRVEDPDRLAAQALGYLDVVDAVTADLGRVDVLERQLHGVVHVEGALCLADQAEVGVVHHHVQVRDVEL